MTITIHIDGWPHTVLFTGTIEIERMADGETVAIRRASTDAKVWGVALDHKELDRQREFMREMRIRTESWNRWWQQQIEQPELAAVARSYRENIDRICKENTHGDV